MWPLERIIVVKWGVPAVLHVDALILGWMCVLVVAVVAIECKRNSFTCILTRKLGGSEVTVAGDTGITVLYICVNVIKSI